METERRLLVHFLATIAYRTQKALRNAPDGFSDFRTAAGVRTPHQLVRHMSDVLGFADRLVSGGPPGRAYAQPTFDGEVARFHRVLTELRATVAAASADTLPAERLLQGPLADAMSHVGQLAMLRRLAGAPIPPENFLEAEVSSDNVGADQSEARSPDAEWFAAEDEPYGVTDNPDATSEGGMNRYRHTQIGWVMLATAIVPLTIVVGVLGRAGEPLLLLLPLAILIPVLAVFGWLTVTIDDRELNARFGVSPVRKRIALASIASFEPVRNR